MFKFLKIGFCAILLAFPVLVGAQTSQTPAGQAQERILSYHSDINVSADASMTVKDTIQVISAGQQISHGIYRDFPIAYRDRLGHRYNVAFDLLEVTRDGQSESSSIQRGGNGLRIYIGKQDVLVPPGVHTYTITYKTERQLGFFNDHDELYWNVTGQAWVFPIDSVTTTVKLPGNIPNDKITVSIHTVKVIWPGRYCYFFPQDRKMVYYNLPCIH
jgi:uncharacterized membrane protein